MVPPCALRLVLFTMIGSKTSALVALVPAGVCPWAAFPGCWARAVGISMADICIYFKYIWKRICRYRFSDMDMDADIDTICTFANAKVIWNRV